MIDTIDITDYPVLIHVGQTTSTNNQVTPYIAFNTSCLPEQKRKKPLSQYKSAKFTRMYGIILKTSRGPHSRVEPHFHPSFALKPKETRFLEDFSQDISELPLECTELPVIVEELSDFTTASSLLRAIGSKRLCSRLIDRPRREVPARKRSIKQIEHVEWREGGSSNNATDAGWGAESPAPTKGILQDLGIVVNNFQLSWEELQVSKKRPYRCYMPSGLRAAWSYGSRDDLQAWE